MMRLQTLSSVTLPDNGVYGVVKVTIYFGSVGDIALNPSLRKRKRE